MPESGEWDALFAGVEEVLAEGEVAFEWLQGLSASRSVEVLARLATENRYLAYDRQPPEVVDAAVACPDWRIRRYWVENQRGMSLAQWERLIRDEPPLDWQRTFMAYHTRQHAPRPTAQWFARRAADPDPRVRLRTLWFRGLPAEVAVALAADPDPQVRREVCLHAWYEAGEASRAALLADPDPRVREAAREEEGGEPRLSLAEFAALDAEDRLDELHEQGAAEELLRHLAVHPDPKLRRYAAGARLDPELLAALAADPDEDVRAEIAVREDVPDAVRDRAAAGLPPDRKFWHLKWVEDLHDDPAAMRRLAASASVPVRRSVAEARTLPPDVLARLAHDPVSGVRDAITAHNEAAPPELLLEAARTWNYPGSVLHHPHFPFDRLRAAWADDPEPTVRRLALYAPDCTPELVERLAEDPDERVHQRAAADPRLPAAALRRLLDTTGSDVRAGFETDGLRRALARNPALPVPVLIGLLRDREQARAAAANPAVPAAVALRMIDLAAARL
ncbi:hypothetical protein Kpho02_38590 [Kitasatospora phosalacinea]|uniref:Uncharacterized protein n=1 Tax=Kitasatospora phosalacinea TaxID=2065 RepID=A0A9W6Q7Y9_9ACTN|nr:hypothetical protein [Kitasatospora phosalacinea]GLW71560.1 hypothetical protein Kpho02_38590 [Kitasatospora phosalacinea]